MSPEGGAASRVANMRKPFETSRDTYLNVTGGPWGNQCHSKTFQQCMLVNHQNEKEPILDFWGELCPTEVCERIPSFGVHMAACFYF